MDYIVHGVTKSWTQLSNFYFPDFIFLLIKDLFSGWQFPLLSGHLNKFLIHLDAGNHFNSLVSHFFPNRWFFSSLFGY